jgi:nicotinamidase-related amidase
MATLENRPSTALVILDFQTGVVAEAHERDVVVANVGRLVARARATQVPVVWVQHEDDEHLARGSAEWQIVPELDPAEDEAHVAKRYADAFDETTLESVLARLGAGRLVLAGAQTDECIRSTLHGAVVRGYDATLVSDAHTTEDLSPLGAPPPALVIAHTNLYWGNHRAPGRTAAAVATDDVDFGAPA